MQITALVDGALSTFEREAALAHLARCSQCRAQAEAERATKARVSGLTGPGTPAMSEVLRAQLLRLATASLPTGANIGPALPLPLPPLLRPASAAFTSGKAPHGSSLLIGVIVGVVATSLGVALAVTISGPAQDPGGGTGSVVQPASYVVQHDRTSVTLLQDPTLPAVAAVSLR